MPTTSLLRPTLLVLAFGLFLLVFVPACGPNKPVDEPVTAGPVTPPAPAVTRLAAEDRKSVV